MAEKLTVPAITGPTGSGKTELVLSLAEGIPLEVVVCDSRKLFRGLDIGTAKPDLETRQRVRFHLLDLVDPEDSFTVYDFVPLAVKAVSDIVSRGKLPVLEGGTGLYLSALARGFKFERAPAIPELREALADVWARDGYEDFLVVVLAVFPEAVQEIDARNPRRMLRFLEDHFTDLPDGGVTEVLSALNLSGMEGAIKRSREERERRRRESGIETGIGVAGFVLEVRRDVLKQRIRERTRLMFERGLVSEVEELMNVGVAPDSQALQGIGYREVVEHLLGHSSMEEVEAQVVIRTLQLAKRQVTWFRHQLPDFARLPFNTDEERKAARETLGTNLRRLHKSMLAD